MALLVDGITQLQAVMIKQMDKKAEGDRSPETVKPGTPALPSLKEVCADTSCVDVMDWMEVIDGPMSDLSDSSASWWRRVTTEANRAYTTWSLASPLERLQVAPEVSDLEDGKFSRLNSRAAAMVVAALHDSVRQEVVARRLTGSTVRLIFRILTLYQPGGEGEKLKILQNLQSPSSETEASSAVTSLRTWSRWLRRCRDLGVQAPDPSLLVRGLSKMVQAVMDRNKDASFRTSLVKSTLQIDTNPSYDKVDSYFQHLMAECEALAVASTSSTPTSTTTTTVEKPEPRIKPMRAEPKTGQPSAPAPPPKSPSPTLPSPTSPVAPDKYAKDKKEVPCKYFGKTYKGCARGSKCPFAHSWEGLEKERASRCLECGGKHMVKDRVNKKGGSPTSTSTAKAPPATKATPPTSSSSTTTNKTVRIEETSGNGDGTQEVQQADLKEVLADVGKMLKAMSATTLRKASVRTDPLKQRICMFSAEHYPPETELEDEGKNGGLLDSGASNAMRAATEEEYNGRDTRACDFGRRRGKNTSSKSSRDCFGSFGFR